jgi:hypothetical protein
MNSARLRTFAEMLRMSPLEQPARLTVEGENYGGDTGSARHGSLGGGTIWSTDLMP